MTDIAPLMAQRATSSSSNCSRNGSNFSVPRVAPQAGSSSAVNLADGIHCGAVWKSPRSKQQSIQSTLRSYQGAAYADFRVYEMQPNTRMAPTSRGITVSLARLAQFTKLAGNTYRKAAALGLTSVSSW